MSQVYQIRLQSSITHTLSASDRMRHRVELSDILDKQQMDEVLRQVLEEAGWEEGEDGAFETRGPNGERLVWDVESGEVHATLEKSREVATDIAATGYGESNTQAQADAERALERQRQRAQGQFQQGESDLEREITEALAEGEASRLRELNSVLQRVYAEALKRKAEQLGTVVSIEESQDGDDYELVIRVNE